MSVVGWMVLAAWIGLAPPPDAGEDTPVAAEPEAPASTEHGSSNAAAHTPAADEQIEVADVSQDDGMQDWYSEEYPQFERALDQMTGRTARKGSINAIIVHRNH